MFYKRTNPCLWDDIISTFVAGEQIGTSLKVSLYLHEEYNFQRGLERAKD